MKTGFAPISPANKISLYLHVLFCRSMCWYYDCHTTIMQQDKPIRDYIRGLHREIELVADKFSDCTHYFRA
ncbi:MAG: hypothetical protein IH582_09855 [Afipia sp.]|nr:hypothetical protein [Afipia sp.]